jgi:hypothetical protein
MGEEPRSGSGYGREPHEGEPPAGLRDTAPDYLGSVDGDAPVSGHVLPPASGLRAADAPEHDWGAASALIVPAFRPLGAQGVRVADLAEFGLAGLQGARSHAQPLLDEGPGGLPIVYLLPAGGFDVIVNGEHVLSWGVKPSELQDAALRNLAAWSATAPWSDEASGGRRILSSDSGDGCDAVRILLPEVREHLARELGATGRVLVGLPERHLLLAGTLHDGDADFADLFADFVVEQSGGADEPIDRRVFELVGGQLIEFAPAPAR